MTDDIKVIFTESKRAFGSPVCPICRHYLGGRRCKAFDMIPDELFVTGLDDHRQPYPGDGGIRFEAIDGDPFVVLDEVNDG